MSKISRMQIKHKQQLRATRENSIASKEALNEKYAKNLLMMEKLHQKSMDCDQEQDKDGSSDNSESDNDTGFEEMPRQQSGGDHDNKEYSAVEDNDKQEQEIGKEQEQGEEVRSPRITTTSSFKKKKEKEVNQEYIKACLAAAEQKAKDDNSDDGSNEPNRDSLIVIDHQLRFRKQSIDSFSGIDNPADLSLCSTEDDSTVEPSLQTTIIQTVLYIQQYKNINRLLAIVLFYVIGVVFYSYHEEWTISDTIYFITVSITTVGFGDLVPTNDVSKIFTMFYALLGLVVIFSYVNNFAESILVYAENQAQKLAEKRNRNEEKDVPVGVPYAKYRRKIFIYLALVFVVIIVGTVFYMYNEEWTFVNALYFSFVATMTIGYGDPKLQNPSSRTFSIFYVLFSVVTIALALGNIGAIKLTVRQEKKKFEMLHKKLDLNSIIAMDDDGNGVDRVEFLTAMLMQMNGLSKEDDIDPWLKRFDELDKDGSGMLDQEDLRLFAEEEEIRKQVRRDLRKKLEEDQSLVRQSMKFTRSLSHLFKSIDGDDCDEEQEEKEKGGTREASEETIECTMGDVGLQMQRMTDSEYMQDV